MSEEDRKQNLLNALRILMLISIREEEIKNGNVKTHEEVFENIEKLLREMEKSAK